MADLTVLPDLSRRLVELGAVSRVALMAAAGHPFDELVAGATQELHLVWPGAQSLGFLFWDETGGAWRPHATYWGLSPARPADAATQDLGLVGRAAGTGEAWRRSAGGDDRLESDYGGGVAAEMAAPLVADQQVIGVVSAVSAEPNAFSDADVSLLAALARQLAVLFAKAQSDARQEAERSFLTQQVQELTLELAAVRAELARSVRLKDEFLTSMSHELRTPLTPIIGLAEALQEGVYGPLAPKQLAGLQTIEESGRSLLAIINDILDLSQIGAGEKGLDLGLVGVEAICSASMQFVRRMAQKKRISLSITLDERAEAVIADERRLKQILVNLLSNAVKYTPEGGAVSLGVEADSAQQLIRFSVSDTGIGIAPEDLDRVYQPFVQLEGGLARPYTGIGLGLALVQKLVALHEGRVLLESTVGKGSRFTVLLPWQEPPAPPLTQAEKTGVRPAPIGFGNGPAGGPALVLLADDNQASVEALVDYLDLIGYRVISAQDGLEALVRARAERPDLILMDMQMPKLSGGEAIRRLRGDPDLAHIPVIALTARALPGDRERCLEAGADDYLSKPLSLRELSAAIGRLLERGSGA